MKNSKFGTLILIGLAFEALIVVLSVIADGFTLEAIHTITRFSGRLSLLAFSLILLLYDKRGVIRLDMAFALFAFLHAIHLVELLFYVNLSGMDLITTRVLGGALTYALIFAMPFVFDAKEKAKLSLINYNRIEAFYFTIVWLGFFLTYLPRVMGDMPNAGGAATEHAILFGWVSLLGLIKMVSIIGAKMQ
ncbi:MAG: hypothetical protein JST48_12570 [Bacteroidetes bacterium]|nr:hypothetical protein [Bacteroidota bacterium]